MRIPIKKYEMDESLSWEERYHQLEAHHEEETTWFVERFGKIDDWYKFGLFFGFGITKTDKDAWCYCLGHMVRELSRGRIPSFERVTKTLSGEMPVPPCGNIGCVLTSPAHVH